MLIPTGFWSYTTSDEMGSRGKLSQLRALISAELQMKVGRSPTVRIFQDVAAIPPGEEWERQIREAIESSSFLVPIVTPGFLQSEWCCREVMLFREREAALGVRNLVFPIHYVDVGHVDGSDPDQCLDAAVLASLRSRQWTDFRQLRFRAQDSEDVALVLETLAQAILKALREASVTSRRAKDDIPRAEASRLDEDPLRQPDPKEADQDVVALVATNRRVEAGRVAGSSDGVDPLETVLFTVSRSKVSSRLGLVLSVCGVGLVVSIILAKDFSAPGPLQAALALLIIGGAVYAITLLGDIILPPQIIISDRDFTYRKDLGFKKIYWNDIYSLIRKRNGSIEYTFIKGKLGGSAWDRFMGQRSKTGVISGEFWPIDSAKLFEMFWTYWEHSKSNGTAAGADAAGEAASPLIRSAPPSS